LRGLAAVKKKNSFYAEAQIKNMTVWRVSPRTKQILPKWTMPKWIMFMLFAQCLNDVQFAVCDLIDAARG
jgi:hypothetical protein